MFMFHLWVEISRLGVPSDPDVATQLSVRYEERSEESTESYVSLAFRVFNILVSFFLQFKLLIEDAQDPQIRRCFPSSL
jgi:hypothetical protein